MLWCDRKDTKLRAKPPAVSGPSCGINIDPIVREREISCFVTLYVYCLIKNRCSRRMVMVAKDQTNSQSSHSAILSCVPRNSASSVGQFGDGTGDGCDPVVNVDGMNLLGPEYPPAELGCGGAQ